MSQEPQEQVTHFTIRFLDLYCQLAQDVSAHHIPNTFLAGLREPLQTTLALTDFPQQTIKQVITRVLAIDQTQDNRSFSMREATKLSHSTREPPLPTSSNARPAQALAF